MMIEATVYPSRGVVVSTIGSLHVVQDLQGRLVEVALNLDGRGGMDLILASDASVSRWRKSKTVSKSRARARTAVEHQRARKAANQRALYERKKVAKLAG